MAEWDGHTFRAGRAAALQQLEQQLEHNRLVVVDDTMHLRSMRREVYALGRARGVPVVIIWLRAPLALALARNSTRAPAYQVDEAAISRIHAALEPPDGSLVQDRCFLVVDADSEEEEESRARSLLGEALALAREERPRLLQRAAAAAAALYSSSSVAAKAKASSLQALELRLRQLTAVLLRALPTLAAAALQDRQVAAAALSAAKKLALASARKAQTQANGHGHGQGLGQGQREGAEAEAQAQARVQDCTEAFVEAVAAALPDLGPEARAALFSALDEGDGEEE
jgi:hypothetical protein